MAREIEITIDQDGKVEIEAFGFKGKGCHEVLDSLCRSLGKLERAKRKAEFYESKVTVGVKDQVRG